MFTTYIITMVLLAVLCGVLLNYSDAYSFFGFISTILGVVSGLGSFLIAVFLAVVSYNWHAAEYQANIINREYSTNYTQEEIFYASNVIETIREIQRNRNEVTLNLNTDK